MKKNISIVVLFIMILIQFSVFVQAAEPCSISLKPSKQSLSKSEELVVDISMSNITVSEGITGFLALLEYSKDKFDVVIDESEDAQDVLAELEGTEYEGCKVIYVGQNDDDSEILNPWTLLLIESEGEMAVAGITNEPQKQSQKIAKIKFKVKDNVTSSDTEKILLDELTVIGEEDDMAIADAYTTVKISGSQSISIGTSTNTANKTNSVSSYNKTNTSTNKNTSTNTNGGSLTQTSSSEVPEAGTPIIFPIILIAVGIIVFKYKKYNDEYKNI